MAQHSTIGASSASRWFECPGSIALIAKAPPQEQNKYAAEGTAAHQLAEKCLQNGKFPDDYFGEVIQVDGFEFEVDQEMCDAVNIYIDEISQNDPVHGGFMVLIEQKIDLTRLHPGLFGTADAIKRNFAGKKLKVVDFKYGKGTVVEVKNNKQGMYYVLGAIEAIYQQEMENNGDGHPIDDPLVFGWDQFAEVELVIVQPRARHIDGPVRRWVIPKGTLDAFQDELVEKAKATALPNAPLKGGSHCKFCPALAICPAQLQMISDSAAADFKPIVKKQAPVLPAVEALTMEQLTGVLKYADQISSWIKSVEAHAFTLMSHGTPVAGFKLVKKKANRRWVNEDEARAMLSLYMTDEEMLTAPELKSPAQVEKSLKKAERELIKQYIETPDTGLTMAEESDPRPAIEGGSVMDDFKTL